MKIDEVDELFLLVGVAEKASLKEEFKFLPKNKNSMILVPELRPYLIGLNYHVPILKKIDLPFIYITDNMVGYLFFKKKIKKTVLFYETKEERGLWSITGSLYFCLLSWIHKVPIKISSGKVIKSETFLDKDAKSIDGTPLIMNKNSENYIIPPQRELVRWEILI